MCKQVKCHPSAGEPSDVGKRSSSISGKECPPPSHLGQISLSEAHNGPSGKTIHTVVDDGLLEDSCDWLEPHAVVGFVFGVHPQAALENWVKTQWMKGGSFITHIRYLHKGFLVFLFKSPAMAKAVVHHGLWAVRNQPLYLDFWTQEFSPDKPKNDIVPVWVVFPLLSLCNQLQSSTLPWSSGS